MKKIDSRTGLITSAAMVLALSLAAVSSPAHADDEPSTGASGVLEVEIRPAIATPSGVVTVAAEYELEDGEEEEDDDEPDAGTGAPVEPLAAELPGAGPGAAAVEMVVDFGDGSTPQSMRVVGSSEEVKGFGKHAYAEAGTYTVTVTATATGGEPVSVPVEVQVGGGTARMGGKDRFETANRLAREDFPTDGEAGAVLLARSDAFADALAAAPVALLEEAPVLLTATADLPVAVQEEIVRALGETGTVYVLGGDGAISPAVVDQLTAAGYEVVRIAGADRIETSLKLAQFLIDAGVDIDEVVLTSSSNFPDALAGAAFAASVDAPVLLTAPGALDPRVLALLERLGDDVTVHVAGGAGAVSDTIVEELRAAGLEVERLAGSDRYETSAEIASILFPAATTVVLATGSNFPDALAGAAAAGRRDAPVLLVGTTLPESVRDYLQAGKGRIQAVYVLGGDAAVPASVRAEVEAILGL
ncbi:putative cell wall binding repeat protein [Kineococcus xinjiangensis]|uniref:Putative cell wall binding repeat protein n=1 Tax=Kineococcus xinjiangensis TaxID=512762 RepID=A0A2S6IEN8_9ACTN|nr:cell wall-binding repeat-containing protein [Kineococcus xinjiangensis]PPK92682.1 putative cell wall binding repeat protein [Kineococcus xinjiangensis]